MRSRADNREEFFFIERPFVISAERQSQHGVEQNQRGAWTGLHFLQNLET